MVYDYQHNRNPFIDHPEYVTKIWGSPNATIDIEEEIKVNVYPNPTSGFIVFDVDSVDPIIIELLDIFGRVVLTDELSISKRINISHLLNGIYMYKIHMNGKILCGKLMVE